MVYNDCLPSLGAGPRISFPGNRIPSLPQRMWLHQVKFRGLPRRAVMWGGDLLWLQHHAYSLGLEDKLRSPPPHLSFEQCPSSMLFKYNSHTLNFSLHVVKQFSESLEMHPSSLLMQGGELEAKSSQVQGHQAQLCRAESGNEWGTSSTRPCLDKRMIITLFFPWSWKKQR